MADVPELDCISNIYCFSNEYTCEQLTPRMKPLMIQLQENHYTLPPEAYSYSKSNIFMKKCTIAVSYTDSSGGVYILGDTFLRNFVTTFDFANGEMLLTQNKYAPTGVSIVYKMSGWKLFGIIAGVIIVVLLLVWLVCCCCKRHKQRKLAKGYKTIGHNIDLNKEEPLAAQADYAQHWRGVESEARSRSIN